MWAVHRAVLHSILPQLSSLLLWVRTTDSDTFDKNRATSWRSSRLVSTGNLKGFRLTDTCAKHPCDIASLEAMTMLEAAYRGSAHLWEDKKYKDAINDDLQLHYNSQDQYNQPFLEYQGPWPWVGDYQRGREDSQPEEDDESVKQSCSSDPEWWGCLQWPPQVEVVLETAHVLSATGTSSGGQSYSYSVTTLRNYLPYCSN